MKFPEPIFHFLSSLIRAVHIHMYIPYVYKNILCNNTECFFLDRNMSFSTKMLNQNWMTEYQKEKIYPGFNFKVF